LNRLQKARGDLAGADDAVRLAHEAMSPRARELAELERWHDGTQYEGQPDWFTATENALFERAPCIVYPFARSAISSHVDLVLGDGRFPIVSAGLIEADSPLDGEDEDADDDDRAMLDRFIVETMRQSKFERAARHALSAAMHSRSSCLIFGARNGKLFVDLVKSRWCEPENDDDGAVTKLVIQYPYTQAKQRDDGHWELRAYLFRREIDDESDKTYYPHELGKGRQVEWVVDPSRTVTHGLGFCPVVWYAFEKGCGVEGRIDGKAIHEDLLDEMYALDFALSLRHRSAIYLEPQIYETGVDPGYNPTEAKRMPAEVMATRAGGAPTALTGDNPINGAYVARNAGQQTARAKSPDRIWQYENHQAKVGMLALDASALKALDEHARDLRAKLAESVSVVFLDPGDIKHAAALSGKALETLRSRQLARCDQIRSDVEDGLILPGVAMLLRIVSTLGSGKVRVPGIASALDLLSRFSESEGSLVPELRATWPPYFDIDHDEIQKVSETVRADLDANIITRRNAVAKLADFYGIDDIEAHLDQLKEDAKEARAEMHEAMKVAAGESEDEDGAGEGTPGSSSIGGGSPPSSRRIDASG